MDFRYQADIARALGKIVAKGLVYKGKKPVHWCIHCRTALAEAEVEYADRVSPSIYVEFPLAPDSQRALAFARAQPGGPFSVGGDLDDDLGRFRRILPSPFIPSSTMRRTTSMVARSSWRRRSRLEWRRRRLTAGFAVAVMKGADWSIRFQHPLYTRESIAVLADYVTLDAGTGAVHTRRVTAPMTSPRV